ncbi:MAG: GIY-YIG nuclease family protein [Meiothermus sp.]|nr:GIY-YIG nuclease family protein [Meiothermus sp.]
MNSPGVYFIQLSEPLCTSRRAAHYYIGSAKNIDARLDHYRTSKKINRNSFMTEAKRRGIHWRLVYVIPTNTAEEARELEARLKRRKKSARKLMRGGVAL